MQRRYMKLSFNTKNIFLINLCINLIFLLFLIPIINLALKFSMKISGQSYITAENLVRFLISPSSIIFILLIIVIVPFLILTKLVSIVYYCNTQRLYRKPYLSRNIIYGFFKTLATLRKHSITYIYYSVMFYIFTMLPVLIGITFYTDLGNDIHGSKELTFRILIILLLIYIHLIFFRTAFTFHFGMMDDIDLKTAKHRSRELFKNHWLRIVKRFYAANLKLTLGFFLFYYFLLFVTCLSVYQFSSKSLAISVFLSAYPRINLYATIFYGMVTFTVNMNLMTSIFHTYHGNELPEQLPELPKLRSRHRYFANSLLLILLFAAAYNFYLVIHNDSLFLSDALSGILISSHRGSSQIAPENTIPALENAILANSDYAEIDVRETKDGVLILLHDKNLYRTSGVDQYIWNMSYPEIIRLDVGSWFGNEFIDTRIPTLEEVLVLCKGKIKLNIEVKASKKYPYLEEKLVSLIEQYDYVNQCVVSSADYTALIKIKRLNEDIKTGYIMTAVYGTLYDKEYADFYSIRSRFITKKIVESAHREGKEVHAWTVDSTRELERLKSIGIDCIITNNPIKAREVLYRDDTNESFIQLINRMFRNRSLYTFLNY